jgi:hypothetical protein
MLLALALIVGGTLLAGAAARNVPGPEQLHGAPAAGPEQMSRQAQAMQAFQAHQYAVAYGRFAALADDGDAPSALIALAMVRHGKALFGSEWSVTRDQLRHWGALALHDVHRLNASLAEHDRGE